MRSLTLIGFFLFLLTSCQDEEKIVYILFDNSEGLNTDNKVVLNGVNVGDVIDIDVTKDYEVLATVQLSKSLDFPKDTQFEIQSQDLFTKMIHVTIGDSKTLIDNGDTIQGMMTINPVDQVSGGRERNKLLDDVKEMLKN
jgi:ABC-type transporter Mla subunit MlaD